MLQVSHGRRRGRVRAFGLGTSSLTLLPFVLLAASPSAAQTPLPGVIVTAPPPGTGTQPGPAVEGPGAPATQPTAQPSTPLNLNTVTESASRLGLTPLQTPATVEVLNQQQIREEGYRTTTEAAQGFVGVTAGDSPGAPASYSMRGFSGTQINTLYNGIKIGPSEMTGRVMDTGNLDRIEILKGPASLLSGEGATGGAVNYVTKAAPYRADRERVVRVLGFLQRLSLRDRVRRQHDAQGPGLPLRPHTLVAQ